MGSPTSSRLKPVMETDRLFLRDWDPPNDAEAAFLLYGDPSVVRHLHMPPQASIETQRDALTQIQAKYANCPPGYGAWAVLLRETGELIGLGLINVLPLRTGGASKDVQLGWHLARRFWGNGYATEMGGALVRHAFEVARLNVLHAVVEPENTKSCAVAERLGFVRVAPTDRYYQATLEHFVLRSPAAADDAEAALPAENAPIAGG